MGCSQPCRLQRWTHSRPRRPVLQSGRLFAHWTGPSGAFSACCGLRPAAVAVPSQLAALVCSLRWQPLALVQLRAGLR